MAKAKQGNAVLELRYLGQEPNFSTEEEVTKIQLIRSMNWYNATQDSKDAKKYLIASLKNSETPKEVVSAFSDINDADCMTIGFLCRMIARGAKLSEQDRETFDNGLTGLVAAAESIAEEKKPEETTTTKAVVSVQDRIRAQAQKVISDFESILDLRNYKDANVKQILVDAGVKGPQAKYLNEWVTARVKEFTEVQKGKEAQLVEGYSNYSKADVKAVIKWLVSLKETTEQIVAVVKAGRKPRARKVKSASQIVGSIKYLKSDQTLKVVSIDPTLIVGALQLWVFNVKTRKLGVFNAEDAQGLTVKGTTVKGFDAVTSFAKTVRKPEVKLPELMGAGKVALRHFMDGINAKQAVLKGRLGEDVLLLKVVK